MRGLAYYSDFIVETNLNFKVTNTKGKEVDIGSICSGGAYAKLISRFRGVDIQEQELALVLIDCYLR